MSLLGGARSVGELRAPFGSTQEKFFRCSRLRIGPNTSQRVGLELISMGKQQLATHWVANFSTSNLHTH
jgi:hypothetical protein